MIDFTRNHFELFGLPAHYRVDTAALERAYRALQGDVHPDRHAAGSDAERRLALQSSARVNEAYAALKDPVERARYLLALEGVDALDETDTRLPFDFLERQLERRELADDAAGAGDVPALEAVLEEIRRDATAREQELAALLDVHDAAAARDRLRELKFLHKVAADVDAAIAALDG
jgi:molecular chaperone HscB